jgi:hypothetical protein
MSSLNCRTPLRLFVLCFALHLVAFRSGADELCDAVSRINAAAANGFTSLQGASRPNDRWQAKLQLPDFVGCEIAMINNSPSFLCYGSALSSAAEAKTSAKRLADHLATCIPGSEVIQNEFGQGSMDMVMALDMPVGFSAISTSPTFNPATGQFSDAWSVQLMASSNADVAADASDDSSSAAATPQEETSKPAKFELMPDNLCTSLKKVIAAGTSKFSAILGASIDETTWRTTSRPDGGFDCKIDKYSTGRLAYHCKFLETTSTDGAKSAFNQLNDALTNCLGKSWIASRSTRGNDTEIEFSNEDNGVKVQLDMDKLLRDWAIRIYVKSE